MSKAAFQNQKSVGAVVADSSVDFSAGVRREANQRLHIRHSLAGELLASSWRLGYFTRFLRVHSFLLFFGLPSLGGRFYDCDILSSLAGIRRLVGPAKRLHLRQSLD